MGRFRLEVPLAIQIGAVVALFAAALGTLWYTSSAVVEREERRVRANDRLKEASDQLEARGKDALAAVRQFPDVMEVDDWPALDRRLSEEAGRIRERHPGIEGGYYVPSRPEQPYLPSLPNEPRQSEAHEGSRLPVSPASPPRRNLYDYVDTQVDAAYRKRNELSVVDDIPPLAEHILKRVERRHGWGELSLSPEALATIQERPWPGNVRQLENALARALIAARGRTILPSTWTPRSRSTRQSLRPATPLSPCRSAPCWPRWSAGRSSAPCLPAGQPHQDRRTPRHQPPPALRQDPRV